MKGPRRRRDPRGYVLALAAAACFALALTVVDSLLLIALGAALAVASWAVDRRGRR